MTPYLSRKMESWFVPSVLNGFPDSQTSSPFPSSPCKAFVSSEEISVNWLLPQSSQPRLVQPDTFRFVRLLLPQYSARKLVYPDTFRFVS